MRTLPFTTMSIAGVSVLIHMAGLDAHLELTRSGWLAEPWRLLTAHLAHFTADHLFWDVVAFLVLGAMVETRSRGLLIVLALASALAISAAVVVGLTATASYRGLSGVDTCLFVVAALQWWREWPIVARAALLAVGGKVAYEAATGATLFAESEAFTPVPLAHAIGVSIAALMFGLRVLWNRSRQDRRPLVGRCSGGLLGGE